MVFELYCVVVLLCNILIFWIVVVGIVVMFGFCVLELLIEISVVLWWCLELIKISVLLVGIFWSVVGWINVLLLEMGWWFME